MELAVLSPGELASGSGGFRPDLAAGLRREGGIQMGFGRSHWYHGGHPPYCQCVDCYHIRPGRMCRAALRARLRRWLGWALLAGAAAAVVAAVIFGSRHFPS